MEFIHQVVKKALDNGYLTIEAEEKLRLLLKRKYTQEDFEAFIKLQEAAMTGRVKQQSREYI